MTGFIITACESLCRDTVGDAAHCVRTPAANPALARGLTLAVTSLEYLRDLLGMGTTTFFLGFFPFRGSAATFWALTTDPLLFLAAPSVAGRDSPRES